MRVKPALVRDSLKEFRLEGCPEGFRLRSDTGHTPITTVTIVPDFAGYRASPITVVNIVTA